MPNHDEHLALMRLVTGEPGADEARHLERRLGEDPALRRRYERLRKSWDGLELPAPPPLPDTFRDGVVAAARRLEASEIDWSGAPAWVRSGAAAALVVGLVAGLGAGHLALTPNENLRELVELDDLFAEELDSHSFSLAEAYWQDLEQGGEALLGETPDGEETDTEPGPEGEAL